MRQTVLEQSISMQTILFQQDCKRFDACNRISYLTSSHKSFLPLCIALSSGKSLFLKFVVTLCVHSKDSQSHFRKLWFKLRIISKRDFLISRKSKPKNLTRNPRFQAKTIFLSLDLTSEEITTH